LQRYNFFFEIQNAVFEKKIIFFLMLLINNLQAKTFYHFITLSFYHFITLSLYQIKHLKLLVNREN